MTLPRTNDNEILHLLAIPEPFLLVAFTSIDSVPCDHYRPEITRCAQKMTPLPVRIIDVDENPTLSQNLKVEAVPTTLLFYDGREILRLEGPYCEEALQSRIKHAIDHPDHPA